MNQEKIGKFIAKLRKEKGFTQKELAEKLNITDKAVSKWENGKSLPDILIIPNLCKELEITINDLLNGEVISMENYKKTNEKLLLEMVKEKEEADKRLLAMEIVIGVLASVTFFILIFVASFVEMRTLLRILLIVAGSIIFAFGVGNAIKIEQTAGYYECSKCNHKYVPTYQSVFWAQHIGRTRKMKCPKCGKKSWNKKVISK